VVTLNALDSVLMDKSLCCVGWSSLCGAGLAAQHLDWTAAWDWTAALPSILIGQQLRQHLRTAS